MRISLIYPNVGTGNGIHYPHSLGALAAVCRQKSVTPKVFLPQQIDAVAISYFMPMMEKTDLAAFSFSTHQWEQVPVLATMAKRFGTKVIAGGHHATFATDQVLQCPRIDGVIRGEGEGALADIIDGRSFEEIDNAAGRGFSNPLRPLISDLGILPVYDRDEFPMEIILRENGYELTILAGRGCLWPCSYCCNHAWKGLYENSAGYVRLRPVEHVLEEIELLTSLHRVDSIYFEDDIFTSDRQWLESFCRGYSKKFSLPFRIYLRVGSVTEDQLIMLHSAGCRYANIGIESGSVRLRKEVLNRPMSDEKIVALFDACRNLGISTRGFHMLGFPTETEAEMEQTLELCKKAMPDKVQVSLFHPYPGTQLYKTCLEQGLYNGEIRSTYFDEEPVLTMPQLPPEKVTEFYRKFCDESPDVERRAFEAGMKATSTGEIDLLLELEGAIVDRIGPMPLQMPRAGFGTDLRPCLLAHPRSSLRFPKIAMRGVFKTAIALDPICLTWGGEAVRFGLTLERGDEKALLGEKIIDPKNNDADQGWIAWEVPFESDEPADLVLHTDPHPGEDLTGAWALWARPTILETK